LDNKILKNKIKKNNNGKEDYMAWGYLLPLLVCREDDGP